MSRICTLPKQAIAKNEKLEEEGWKSKGYVLKFAILVILEILDSIISQINKKKNLCFNSILF
jgi:hypothetical protein